LGGRGPVRQVRLSEEVAVDAEWCALTRLGPDGALLVRPDQHVAWRSSSLPADPPAALAAAVTSVAAIP
ncbi:MAG TPA: hypothetical protein PKA98_20080, partial [Acidimicrobiales bacterium]|nr:hypothetical protein [Acidimicrobiales bacterium]